MTKYLFMILCLMGLLIPSGLYADESKEKASATVGKESGEKATEGISAGTIALGTVAAAALITVIAISGSGSSTTTAHH